MRYTTRFLLFDQSGRPSQALENLLALFGITHDGTLESIVEKTQQAFLRPPDKERWQLEDIFIDEKEKALVLLEQLGMVNEIAPTQNQYKYGIILGATLEHVCSRFKHLFERAQQNIHFDQLVFLTGQRFLDPSIEPREKIVNPTLYQLPCKKNRQLLQNINLETETDMMRFVFDQLHLPENIAHIPVIIIDTPRQSTEEGKNRRPNTADTIKHWLSTNPKPGSCLFITNQPDLCHQQAVVRTYMPATFTFEVTAKNAGETSMAEYLDMLARWLYQEQKLQKNFKLP